MECDIFDCLNTIIGAITLIAAIWIAIVENARYSRAKKDSTAVKIAARIDNDIEMVAGQKGAVIISNASNIPIYDVFVSIDIQGDDIGSLGVGYNRCSYVNVVPSGSFVIEVPFMGCCAGANFSASVSFKDEFGQVWTRYSNGSLRRHGRYWIHSKRFFPRLYKETSFSVRQCDPPIHSVPIKPYKYHKD